MEYFVDGDTSAKTSAVKQLKDVLVTGSGDQNAYGNIYVDTLKSGKHHWTFKIHKIQNFSSFKSDLAVGIIDVDAIKDAGNSNPIHTGKAYIYDRGGILYRPEISDGSDEKYKGNYSCQEYYTGDTIQMILDLNDKTLNFSTDRNPDKKDIIDNVMVGKDVRYRVVVWLHFEGDSVELESYRYDEVKKEENKQDLQGKVLKLNKRIHVLFLLFLDKL